jgi:hypothetical protein
VTEPTDPAVPLDLTGHSPPLPHVCDYRDPDGTTAGACHLAAPHGGRCPTCYRAGLDCPHQPFWETQLLCPHRSDCVVHR